MYDIYKWGTILFGKENKMKQFILSYPPEKMLLIDCFCKKKGMTRTMLVRKLLDDRITTNKKKINSTIDNIVKLTETDILSSKPISNNMTMKKLYNLTGHPVVISGITIPQHGSVRLSQTSREIGEIQTDLGTIKLGETQLLGTVLPKYNPDTILIVGVIVAQAFPERGDLYIPWGGDRLKEKKGLQRNPYYVES